MRIAITAGDLAGVSGIIILKAINNLQLKDIPLIIYGDQYFFKKLYEKYEIKLKNLNIDKVEFKDPIQKKFSLDILGNPSSEIGEAAGVYFKTAINDALIGKIDAIVTAPLSKEYLIKGGFNFAGHTGMLQKLTSSSNSVMMLYGDQLKVALLTTHIPLSKVSQNISIESIKKVVSIVNTHLNGWFGIDKPKIAILGLNPHSGEMGVLGNEEIKIINPSIQILKNSGIDISGPFPSDTFFYKKYREFDVVIAIYHDQGLIPLKMLHFDDGVNITLGTPIIRTSPDHGTAYDIAKTFIASENSMKMAILEAYRIAKRVKEHKKIKEY